jgi:Co/Zn/Cd efflux system component
MPGVSAVFEPHLWVYSSDKVVASVHVQVENDADQQKIMNQVSFTFSYDYELKYLGLFTSE